MISGKNICIWKSQNIIATVDSLGTFKIFRQNNFCPQSCLYSFSYFQYLDRAEKLKTFIAEKDNPAPKKPVKDGGSKNKDSDSDEENAESKKFKDQLGV